MEQRIRISSESLNCYGTWVKTAGVDIEQFKINPILLWMHWRGVIIGCVKDIKIEDEWITGEPYFDEVREESKQAKRQYEKGTLKMCSANFEVLEVSDEPSMLKPGQIRPTVTKSKLIEVSMVDIGGNDDAHVLLSYQGKDLKLSANEECHGLPLLKNNRGNILHNNNPKIKEEKMNEQEFKSLLQELNLPEESTVQAVFDAIKALIKVSAVGNSTESSLDLAYREGIISKEERSDLKGLFINQPLQLLKYLDTRKHEKSAEKELRFQELVKTHSRKLKCYSYDFINGEMKRLALKDLDVFSKMMERAPELLLPSDIILKNREHRRNIKLKSEWTLEDYRKNAPQELQRNPDLYKELLAKENNNNDQ